MNKKSLLIIIILISTIFISFSCSKEDPVKVEELIEYYNEEFIPIELIRSTEIHNYMVEYLEIYDSEGSVSDETIYLYHDRANAIAEDAISQLEMIELKNEEVKKLNDIFIEYQKLSIKQTKIIAKNMRGEISHAEYLESYEEMAKKRNSFYDYLEELMEKYNLEYDEENKVDEFLYKIKRSN